jgi:hypothetical protein
MPTQTTHNAYRLASMADVPSPDAADSPAARFLERIQSDVNDLTIEDWDHETRYDAAHEIADGAVPIYTHERWRVFVDLCAYNEDLDEVGGSSGDMTQDAAVALYMIAERLVLALLDERLDTDDDDGVA